MSDPRASAPAHPAPARWTPAGRLPLDRLAVRELTSVDDIRLVQEMERRVWAYDDIDLSPVPLLVAAIKAGALMLGAFVDGRIEAFAVSLPADRHDQRVHWSHILGVSEAWRGAGLGTHLKFEQARRVAARGYSCIQWTYDPLQSVNAYLNLVKLGARATEYAEDVYGVSSSALHRGAPTDRFIVSWDLDPTGTPIRDRRAALPQDADAVRAGRVSSIDGWDAYQPRADLPDASVVLVPVPSRFSAMLQEAPELATAWRLQTRAQFTALFALGYEAVSFRRIDTRGEYVFIRRQ